MRTFIFVFCWLALAAPLAAEDPPDQPAAETAGSAPAPAREAPPSPDRFTPSEEISLDLPVSFPVDI